MKLQLTSLLVGCVEGSWCPTFANWKSLMTHCPEEQEVGLYTPRWDNGTDYQGYRQCVKSLIFELWANSNWRALFGRSGW
jgi:hypothetical protein